MQLAGEKPAPQTVTQDSPRATPGGDTFTGPAGWSIETSASSATLQTPEPDTHIAILDIHAADAAAVTSAWATYRPDMRRPLKVAVAIPDRNGWTDGKQSVYETSPNERAVVVALHSGTCGLSSFLKARNPRSKSVPLKFISSSGAYAPKAYQRE
jgi:hypothetical protein